MDAKTAAKEYLANIRALRSGGVTADEHRAENRRLRAATGDAEWERARGLALAADQRHEGC